MYYHISNHIYIARFHDELIILNTRTDRYTIYNKDFSHFFDYLLTQKINPHDKIYSQNLEVISRLLKDNIIKKKITPYIFYIDWKSDSRGSANINWKLPFENKSISLNALVLKGLYTLIKINFYMKYKGFYQTLQLIKKASATKLTYYIPSEKDLCKLAHTVNKASLLYPTRTKCLEWAMTFILLGLARGWKCNLEIGVQNYPFLAHAWVECNEKIIMDNQALRQEMAIILNEPFRKLKT